MEVTATRRKKGRETAKRRRMRETEDARAARLEKARIKRAQESRDVIQFPPEMDENWLRYELLN